MTQLDTIRRKNIRRKLTEVQRIREMTLVALNVSKDDICKATGVKRQLLSNIFTDRHRSLDAEEKVLAYLNERDRTRWENSTLSAIGVTNKLLITRASFGWPEPDA